MEANILKDKDWLEYLDNNSDGNYIRMYRETYKGIPICRLNDYYFCMEILKGYKRMNSLHEAIIKLRTDMKRTINNKIQEAVDVYLDMNSGENVEDYDVRDENGVRAIEEILTEEFNIRITDDVTDTIRTFLKNS